MSKKNNLKSIFIVLGILLGVLAAIKTKDYFKGDRSFNKYIVKLDTSMVTEINLRLKNSLDEVILVKEKDLWMINNDGKRVQADNEVINELLSQLTELKPKRVAATTKEKWAEFEVTDSLGTLITVKNAKKEVAKLILGKFSYSPGKSQNPYQQPNYIMTSYIRKSKENEVFAVDGYLSMMFNRPANAFREDAVVVGDPDGWKKISYRYAADSAFTLENQNGKWTVDNLLADSALVQGYFAKIRMLTSQSFDNQTIIDASQLPDYSVLVEQATGAPIEVKAYTNSLGERVFTSSQNIGSVFKSEPLQTTLCVNRNYFLKQ